MSGNEEDILEVYNYYKGDNKGEQETVPSTVQKLIVHPGVQILPVRFCYNYERLRQVNLPHGLTKIRACAFYSCKNLVEIKICRTVKSIGYSAFLECTLLAKVEFDHEFSPSLPNQLVKIHRDAFRQCTSLLRIKLPSSVTSVGRDAFRECTSLIEANLSTTRLIKIEECTFYECRSLSTVSLPNTLEQIDRYAFYCCTSLLRIELPSSVTSVGRDAFRECTSLIEANLSTTRLIKIEECTFYECRSLQTVSLPNTLEQIDRYAFYCCYELVTLVVPLDSQSIMIEEKSFQACKKLTYLVLPQGSTAEDCSFDGCDALNHGKNKPVIVTGLASRFGDLPVHKMCYDHSTTKPPELRRCIVEEEKEEDSLLVVEGLGMTPFHVLFSTSEPRMDLLDVLLESPQSNILLSCKDINGKRPVDYLMKNWTEDTASLVQRTLQKWMIDRVARWGSSSTEDMQSKVQEMLSEDDKERRNALYDQLYALMEHCETVEAISILEMALWKVKLKPGGCTSDGVKQQRRYLSGSDAVIPPIVSFLGIQQRTSD